MTCIETASEQGEEGFRRVGASSKSWREESFVDLKSQKKDALDIRTKKKMKFCLRKMSSRREYKLRHDITIEAVIRTWNQPNKIHLQNE
jgi:hypothetical protein